LSTRESARSSLIITARQSRLAQDLTSSPKSEVYTPTATRSLDKEAKPKVTSLRVFPSGLLAGRQRYHQIFSFFASREEEK
jgi:hypothetical protein